MFLSLYRSIPFDQNLSKPAKQMRRHSEDSDSESLNVSIDRRLLKNSEQPAVCTLTTESVGVYKNIGVQATSGMVVDEQVSVLVV